tara:strand:- start:244 stop:1008 length:765 start_codon:yes stop_codon:yes gene_type:complete
MLITFSLPNGKEVTVKQFLYKHIRELILQGDCHASKLEFLESFILTKNLNVIEKFITLLMLREKCVKDTTPMDLDGTDKDVSLSYIKKSFEEFLDIRSEVTVNNIELTLDYPSRFCINTNNILSIIRKVKIEDDFINIDTLSEEEFIKVINQLPAEILNTVNNFVTDKQQAFTFPLLQGKANSIEINFLTPSPFQFIDSIFGCLDEHNYREYLFILSKRITDVNFLINSPLSDLLDYLDLYKKECDDENDKLKK